MPGRRGTGIALLADPTRRRIVALLAIHPMRASVIADQIELSRPATSHHLRLLREAGLIRAMRSWLDGRSVLYSLNPATHGAITAWLAGTDVGRPTRPVFDIAASPRTRKPATRSPV